MATEAARIQLDPGLLVGILENPRDDAARLVAADWLEEHGDLDRAEFIRHGVAMARHTDCPELMRDIARGRPRPYRCGVCNYCKARQACDRLKEQFVWTIEAGIDQRGTPHWRGSPYSYCLDWGLESRWPGSRAQCIPPDSYISPDSRSWHFVLSRGFIEAISCPWELWVEGADAIRACQPVTRVELTTPVRFTAWHDEENRCYRICFLGPNSFGRSLRPLWEFRVDLETLYDLRHAEAMAMEALMSGVRQLWPGVTFKELQFRVSRDEKYGVSSIAAAYSVWRAATVAPGEAIGAGQPVWFDGDGLAHATPPPGP